MDDVAVAIDGAVQDSFASMFESIGSGAASAKEAFAEFARSVLASINRIASQKLAESLFGSLFGAAGATGGASPGTLLSSLLQGSQGSGRWWVCYGARHIHERLDPGATLRG